MKIINLNKSGTPSGFSAFGNKIMASIQKKLSDSQSDIGEESKSPKSESQTSQRKISDSPGKYTGVNKENPNLTKSLSLIDDENLDGLEVPEKEE